MLAYRAGVPIRAAQFLADARALAARLPAGRHIINVCADRYRFTVGFAAALLSGKVSLLPPSHTPEVVRHLAQFAPDVFCLTDQIDCTIELPRLRYPPEPLASPESAWSVPEIDSDTRIAYVFTSGSTGVPVPHPKSWGRVTQCVRDGRERLGLGSDYAVLATVPAQHMYGFESSVLLALHSAGALCAERPFYPADVCAALAALPRPRALICTPIHLRALLSSHAPIPPADLIVSATAPLGQPLAREAEQHFAAPLIEIYGSTETGQLATRRPAEQDDWRLWPQVRMSVEDGRTWVRGGHLEQPTALCDELEILDPKRFRLHGRLADLVNIGGKRSSLAYLTHQLNAITGVLDGAFFFPQHIPELDCPAARVAAAVVAPGLAPARIVEELRKRIDPVFLPRPLLLVERLPRNSTGKLPQEALRALGAGAVPARRASS